MNFQDQTGRTIEIVSTKRIISIVPSQTEFLIDIGLKENLIGVTKFCVHPKGLIQEIGHVGGTKNLNIEKIKALKPDLIIANKEENTKDEIEELSTVFPVWISEINTFDDALAMMRSLGEIVEKEEPVDKLIRKIKEERDAYRKGIKSSSTCLYFIWKNPEMLVGSENFIHSMLNEAGLINLGEKLGNRYPNLEVGRIKETPDYILLSTEPYPFKEDDKAFFQGLFPDSEILLVDGEMFSWYGSRMNLTFDYFRELRLNS